MSLWKKLYWCLFKWRIPYANDEELAGVDAILTQGTARLSDGRAGPGDELLADAAERIHRLYPQKTIIAQDVVARVLRARKIPCVSIDKPENGSFSHSNGHWNTFVIAERQHELCEPKHWLRVVIVVMQDHAVRSLLTYRHIGFKDVRLALVDPVQEHYHHPKSLYWSMRGRRWRFVVRELLARLLFLFTCKI